MKLAHCPKCEETVEVGEDGTALLSIDCPYCGYGQVWMYGEDVDIQFWSVNDDDYLANDGPDDIFASHRNTDS